MKTITTRLSDERLAWLGLFIVILFVGFIRYRLIGVPLERDEGEYGYAAQLILQGIPPYKSVYNMKLPGIYGAYALLLKIFGETHQGIHMGLLAINICTILLVFLLAKHFINPLGVLTSAASFALLSLGESVQGIFANAEHFVLVFSIGGLLITLRAIRNKSSGLFFLSGMVLGIGFLMKQHGIFFIGIALLWIMTDSFYSHPMNRKELASRCFFLVSGVGIVYATLCLILAWSGVFSSFWFWTVDYAQKYLDQISMQYAWFVFSINTARIFTSSPALWVLAGLGAVTLTLKKGLGQNRILIASFVILSFMSIFPGLYFREHYFLLLLPASALLVGISISALQDMLSSLPSRMARSFIPMLVVVFCLGATVYEQRDFLFHMTPLQASRSAHGLNPFVESLEIAKYIREHTNPDDRIAILGSEPQIYFYSQRRSAGSYIYMYPLMEEHEFAVAMQKEMIRQIESSMPALVVFVSVSTSWISNPESVQTDSQRMVFEWSDKYLSKNYRLVGLVEILNDHSLYHWSPDVKWPPRAPFWIALFHRIQGSY